MISKNFSIEEFVETAKERSSWEVLSPAVEESNWADRMAYRSDNPAANQRYSRHLKRLIGYLRYETIPKRPHDKADQLYMAHWGAPHAMQPNPLMDPPLDGAMQTMH